MTAAEAMRRYADQRIFRDADTWEMPRRPFNRSLRPQALGAVKLEQPLTAKAFMNYESLAAQSPDLRLRAGSGVPAAEALHRLEGGLRPFLLQ